MPFLLKTQCIQNKIDADQAIQYVAKHIRVNDYMRNPRDIDRRVTHGYNVLHDAVYLMSDIPEFITYLKPENAVSNCNGYSYEKDELFKGKSQALIDFFKQDKPDF